MAYACVRQADQSDCGPAALATIALHHREQLDRQLNRKEHDMKKRNVTLKLKRLSIAELSPRQLQIAGGLQVRPPDSIAACPCTNICPSDP